MVALGIKTVASAGTPVQIQAASTPCNQVNFQPVKSVGPYTDNAGAIYIGLQGMSKSTGAGVLYVLKPGVPASSVEAKSSRNVNMDDVSNYWVDADSNGDGVLVSYS